MEKLPTSKTSRSYKERSKKIESFPKEVNSQKRQWKLESASIFCWDCKDFKPADSVFPCELCDTYSCKDCGDSDLKIGEFFCFSHIECRFSNIFPIPTGLVQIANCENSTPQPKVRKQSKSQKI
jgi:hypothetical protein